MLSCTIMWFIINYIYIFQIPTSFLTFIFHKVVATYLRCGEILKLDFVAYLPLSPSAKEFWKSVNIWDSYEQEFSVWFFDSWCAITWYLLLSVNCQLNQTADTDVTEHSSVLRWPVLAVKQLS